MASAVATPVPEFNERAPVTLQYLEKGKGYVGHLTNFEAQYNLVVFQVDPKKSDGGFVPKKELGFMVPGSDFFKGTPHYMKGLEFIFDKIKPINWAPIIIESRGYKDGIPVCVMEFEEEKYQVPDTRLDESFQIVWGELCEVKIEPGKSYTGIITHADANGMLYLSLDDSIILVMNKYLQELKLDDLIRYAGGTLTFWDKDKLYLAKCADDGDLYRALIKKESQDKKEVFVQYIDYGNSEWVSKEHVVPASCANTAFNFIPPLAVKVFSEGISAFKPEAMDQVTELLYEKAMTFEVCPTMRKIPELNQGQTTFKGYNEVRIEVEGEEDLLSSLKLLELGK